MVTRRQFVFGIMAATTAHAQQLAHAGWRGNSIAPEAWWKHATFVRCSVPTTTFAQMKVLLDTMSQVGADTLILPDLSQTPAVLFDPSFGTENDLDDLLREVSTRRMHALLTLPLQFATSNPDAVRSWMNRGIAGLDLGSLTDADTGALQSLRNALDRYPGQRILIASTTVPQLARKRDPLTFHIVGQGGTGAENQLVEVNEAQRPVVAADQTTSALPTALASLSNLLPLLLTSGAPILDSRLLQKQELRDALQKVLQLRTSHVAFRHGTTVALTTGQPDLHAWLVRGTGGRETLMIVVNNAAASVTLQLAGALAAQHQRGSYLLALLRSDGGMGALNVQTGVLPPGAAVVGELRGDSYSAPTALDADAPPASATKHRHRRHRRR